MDTLTVNSAEREQMVDITTDVQLLVAESGHKNGVCHIYTQHTTCGLTINENADPDVQSDMLGFLQRLIPQYEPTFKHFEHNSDAHIKSSLVGCSASVRLERPVGCGWGLPSTSAPFLFLLIHAPRHLTAPIPQPT